MQNRHLRLLIIGIAFGVVVGIGLFRWYDSGTEAAEAPPAAAAEASGGESGDLRSELEQLRATLEGDPENAPALVRVGDLSFQAGWFAEAIEFYERALAQQPGDARLMLVIGLCHRRLEQYDEALDWFERAEAAAPDGWEATFNRAVVTGLDQGKTEEALRILDELEENHPTADGLDRLREALRPSS